MTERYDAGSIMRSGFDPKIGGNGKIHGEGVYFAPQGDRESEKFYSKYRDSPTVLKARLRLSNPLRIEGGSLGELRKDLTEKLGGVEATREKASQFEADYRNRYRSLTKKYLSKENPEKFKKVAEAEPNEAMLWSFSDSAVKAVESAMSAEFGRDHEAHYRSARRVLESPEVVLRPPKRGESDQYSYVNSFLGTLARREGYDGLIITSTSKDAQVGGNQILVFDPSKIRVTRPLP